MDNPNVLCEGCGKRVKCRYFPDVRAWLCWRCVKDGKL